MSLKVVVFNGPPRSGKDSAADHMVNLINTQEGNLVAHKRNFKDGLVEIASRILGKSSDAFMQNYDKRTLEVTTPPTLGDHAEWYKDYTGTIAQRVVNKQYSKREWLIYVSEQVVKPFFGEGAFGHMFVNSLPKEGIVFCGDSGFSKELQPVIDHVGVENVLVFQVVREGCTFEGDSRDYLKREDLPEGLMFSTICNYGTEQEFTSKVEFLVGEWLEGNI